MAFFWTTWRRLEPSPRSSNIEPGLEAAVHDPLWMLCRQWQLGEFQGEDVGSPIETHLQMTRTPLTKYSAGPLAPGEKKTGQPLARNVPLEAIIESEAVRKPEAAQLRLAAESGLQFLRLLSPNSDDAARRFIVTEFSLAMPNDEVLRDYDSDTRRFLSVVAGRVPDGWLLHAILLGLRGVAPKGSRAAQISRGMQVWQGWPQAGTAPIQSTVKIWMNWYETVLFIEPPTAGNTAWLPQRMEYAAAVAAPTPGGELVLVAPEYTDGFLDWYSFDAQPGSSLGAVRTDLTAE